MLYSDHKASLLGLTERGKETEVTALLEKGEVTRDELDRALQLALLYGHRAVARRLLEHGADPSHGGQEDRQALAYAAMGGDPELVSMCLSLGTDPNRVDQRNVTALALAAGSLDPFDVVRLLVMAGAKIHHRDGDGETPLSRACQGHSPETVRWMLERVRWVQPKEPHQRPCPLLNSLGHEYEEIQAALLAHPATNIDYRCGPTGGTALFWAAAQGKTASLRRLLVAGADPNIPDKDGLLPVQAAAQRWQWPSLELLARQGVDLEPPVTPCSSLQRQAPPALPSMRTTQERCAGCSRRCHSRPRESSTADWCRPHGDGPPHWRGSGY